MIQGYVFLCCLRIQLTAVFRAENHFDFVDNVLLAYHQLCGITIYSYDRKLMNTINRMDSNKTE